MASGFGTLPYELREKVYTYCASHAITALRNTNKEFRVEVDQYALQKRFIVIPAEALRRMWTSRRLIGHHRIHDAELLSPYRLPSLDNCVDRWGNCNYSLDHHRQVQARLRLLDHKFYAKALHILLDGCIEKETGFAQSPWCGSNYSAERDCEHTMCALRRQFPAVRTVAFCSRSPVPTINAYGADWSADQPLTLLHWSEYTDIIDYNIEVLLARAPPLGGAYSVFMDCQSALILKSGYEFAIKKKKEYIQHYQTTRKCFGGKQYAKTRSEKQLARLEQRELELFVLRQRSIDLNVGPRYGTKFFKFAHQLEKEVEEIYTKASHPNPVTQHRGLIFGQKLTFPRVIPQDLLTELQENRMGSRLSKQWAYDWLNVERRWKIKKKYSIVRLEQQWCPKVEQ